MSLTPEKRAGLQRRLGRLAAAVTTADEDLLVGIYEAVQQGASQRDITYMIGQKPNSKSGIGPKASKGKAILEGRRRA